jgi:murein DD-endopeptidase MepM/ murein hydrolase activator NlpD
MQVFFSAPAAKIIPTRKGTMLQKIIALLSFLAILLTGCSGPALVQPTGTGPAALNSKDEGLTPTGFYWPTTPPVRAYYAGFLADGCTTLAKLPTNHKAYFTGTYHVGTDMHAEKDSAVKAISAGTVTYYSHSASWGKDPRDDQYNDALVIQHTYEKGSFYAVYGHIHTDLRRGAVVTAGQTIGTVRIYQYLVGKVWKTGTDHLHFGIQPGSNFLNPAAWGIM